MTKKTLIPAIVLILVLFFALLFFGWSKRNLKGPISFSISAIYDTATVFIDDKLVGNTPYKGQETKQGEFKIALEGENNNYETRLSAVVGTEVAIKRDLGVSSNFSSGQMVWMEKASKGGSVIAIISNPPDVEVTVDGVSLGTTPLSSSDLKVFAYDTNHKIEAIKEGYEGQTLDVTTKKGFKVNVSLDMFLLPIESNITLSDQSSKTVKIYNLSNLNAFSKVGLEEWIKGIAYYNKTRGKGLPEFNYYIDYTGKIYNLNAQKILLADVTNTNPSLILGYLGNDLADLSQEALDTIDQISGGPAGVPVKKATVAETGTDFGLNVRASASTTAEKLGTIAVGTQVTILEEQTGWAKIRYENTKEGWVSASYLKIETN
ncbi:SH3 domain-containing protein [Candidatus Parcubacteria bacterium]|nr:SH3 domain-containing protein [Patescibacteria group bacterium]MCG2689069.1 SH3 domain-containing protein [Candidatus Parcubacteria bacterium]